MNKKNKKIDKNSVLYYVEVRLVKDETFFHWEIINRSRVLYDYHCAECNRAVIKKHRDIYVIGYFGNEQEKKDDYCFYLTSNINFRTFKKYYGELKKMSENGTVDFLKGVILRRDEYEEFKYLLYGLFDMPEVNKLFNALQVAQRKVDTLTSKIHNREVQLKRLQDEINDLNIEFKETKEEAENKRKKWEEKVKELEQ